MFEYDILKQQLLKQYLKFAGNGYLIRNRTKGLPRTANKMLINQFQNCKYYAFQYQSFV